MAKARVSREMVSKESESCRPARMSAHKAGKRGTAAVGDDLLNQDWMRGREKKDRASSTCAMRMLSMPTLARHAKITSAMMVKGCHNQQHFQQRYIDHRTLLRDQYISTLADTTSAHI
jgi:hypothetical protein